MSRFLRSKLPLQLYTAKLNYFKAWYNSTKRFFCGITGRSAKTVAFYGARVYSPACGRHLRFPPLTL
jgi:hypothetical protein